MNFIIIPAMLQSAAAASISSMALVSFFIVSPRYGKRRYNSKRGVCNKYTRLRLFISDYSEKSESISSDRVAIAASSSAPSAMMVIAVPFDDPERENAEKALRVDTSVFLFNPNAALELIGFLNEESRGSGMKTYLIVDDYFFGYHTCHSLY